MPVRPAYSLLATTTDPLRLSWPLLLLVRGQARMTNTQVTNQPMKANSIPQERNTPIGCVSHRLLNESPKDCPMTHILHTNPFFVVVWLYSTIDHSKGNRDPKHDIFIVTILIRLFWTRVKNTIVCVCWKRPCVLANVLLYANRWYITKKWEDAQHRRKTAATRSALPLIHGSGHLNLVHILQ